MVSGRFGLWLMPEAGARDDLRARIAGLARGYGGVPFEPHVTLLGGVNDEAAGLAARLQTLAAQLRVMTVRPAEIQHRPEYFRCLYIKIVPDAALDRARGLARSLFRHGATAPFEPHISLLYGDLPEALKGTVAARLARWLPRTLRLDRLALYDLAGSPDAWSEMDAVSLR